MLTNTISGPELFVANCALKRFLPGVDSYVVALISECSELPAAERALVRLLASVNAKMRSQGR